MLMVRSGNGAGLLVGFCTLVAAFCGVVVSVFRIPVLGKARPDDSFGLLTDRQGNAIGAFLVFLLGALLIFLPLRGLFKGSMPALGAGPDLVFAQAPLEYLFSFAVWFCSGTGVLWLSWRVGRARKTRATPRK
ncbi:hypothetical protein VVD49_19105 [Uliginosibacterium sp. H3]|uniref:Transmembrane protein n=1 Tax=Uliginosibacterium silvisoli TaxID=3114758 RepID=A0ABU6K7I4_9RHOO|nr:hypothetical protein [Uliginosibacterium sp. H3]